MSSRILLSDYDLYVFSTGADGETFGVRAWRGTEEPKGPLSWLFGILVKEDEKELD